MFAECDVKIDSKCIYLLVVIFRQVASPSASHIKEKIVTDVTKDRPSAKQPLKDSSNDKQPKPDVSPDRKEQKSSPKVPARSPVFISHEEDTNYDDTFEDSKDNKEKENQHIEDKGSSKIRHSSIIFFLLAV